MSFHQKPATYVSHVHLLVEQLDRSLAFYQKILGFQILDRTDNKTVLTLDGKNALITLEQPESVKPRQKRTTGLYHLALLVPSRKELAKVVQHFLDVQYPLQGASDHLVSEALYLADPDGHGIEIYRDREAAEWPWNGNQIMMATEALNVRGLLEEAEGEPFTGLSPDTIMGHIHLTVSNIEKSQEFYGALGFEPVSRYGSQALFVSTEKYHHHIGLNTWNGEGVPAPEKNTIGMKYFTMVFADDAARRSAITRLEALGYSVDGYMAADYSGNVVEFAVSE